MESFLTQELHAVNARGRRSSISTYETCNPITTAQSVIHCDCDKAQFNFSSHADFAHIKLLVRKEKRKKKYQQRRKKGKRRRGFLFLSEHLSGQKRALNV